MLVDLAKQVVMPDDCTASPESGFDFSGELGPVTVDAVLRLLSHSCYSGVLSVGNEAEFYSVQISHGSITEIESSMHKTMEGALEGLKTLGSGEFRFRYRCRPQLALVSPMTARLVEDVLAQPAQSRRLYLCAANGRAAENRSAVRDAHRASGIVSRNDRSGAISKREASAGIIHLGGGARSIQGCATTALAMPPASNCVGATWRRQ